MVFELAELADVTAQFLDLVVQRVDPALQRHLLVAPETPVDAALFAVGPGQQGQHGDDEHADEYRYGHRQGEVAVDPAAETGPGPFADQRLRTEQEHRQGR